MQKLKLSLLFVITGFCLHTLNAQMSAFVEKGNSGLELNSKDIQLYTFPKKWIFGLGLNLLQDDITGVNSKIASNFNTPFILSTEYLYTKHFSFYASLSLNKYLAGKSVDSRILQNGSEASYVAFDFSTKFYFLNLEDDHMFESYILGGLGYSSIGSYIALDNRDNQLKAIPAKTRVTINAGFGVNYWFSKSLGININIMAKHGYKYGTTNYVSNQVQFSFGIIYSKVQQLRWGH